MTDPTLDTLEALEVWVTEQSLFTIGYQHFGLRRQAVDLRDQIARVHAAHSHLLKGNDDA